MASQVNIWNWSLQQLTDQAITRSLHFEEKLKELNSERFISKAPLSLISFLLRLNGEIRRNLIQLIKRIPPDSLDVLTYETFAKEIRFYSITLAEIYPYILFIENSRSTITPPGISIAVENFAHELVNSDFTCLVCPSYLCNYFYLDLFSEELFKSPKYSFPKEIFEKFPPYFFILAFPSIAKNDILTHCILGHELGHFIARAHNILDRALSKGLTLEKDLPLSLRDLKRYFEEYVADIASVYLFGPAMLFAFVEFGTSVSDFVESSATHPPLFLRLKNALETLNEYKYLDIFADSTHPIAKETKKVLDGIRDLVAQYEQCVDKKSKDVFLCLEKPLRLARNLIKNINAPLVLDEEIFESVERLVKKGVPPSSKLSHGELKPVELGNILIMGWLYKIAFMHRNKLKTDQYTRRLADLSRLIGKAVEQSEMLHLYQKRRETK